MKKVFILLLIVVAIIGLTACNKEQKINNPPSFTIHTESGDIFIELSEKSEVELSYEKGNLVELYQKLASQGKSANEILEYVVPDMAEELKNAVTEHTKEPVNANYSVKDGKFIYEAEKDGEKVDEEETVLNILRSIDNGEKDITFKPVIRSVKPEITLQKLKEEIVKRGSYTTNYASSSMDRKANIRRAAEIISGTVVEAGATFSFNSAVVRSVENGFKDANIILDGEYVKGIGGGVCQVSSTLYNAAIRADMTIVARKPHSIPASYVPKGLDAMVSDQSDMAFVNNSKNSVYIEAIADDSLLTISIYGAKMDYKIEAESVLLNVMPIYEEILYDTTGKLADGEKFVIKKGRSGYATKSYAVYTFSDGRVEKRLLSSDIYQAQKQITVMSPDYSSDVE